MTVTLKLMFLASCC